MLEEVKIGSQRPVITSPLTPSYIKRARLIEKYISIKRKKKTAIWCEHIS